MKLKAAIFGICSSISCHVLAERPQLLCHPAVYYTWQPRLLTDDLNTVAWKPYLISPANSYVISPICYRHMLRNGWRPFLRPRRARPRPPGKSKLGVEVFRAIALLKRFPGGGL